MFAEIVKEAINILTSHPALLSFVGSFILGGETILILSILAGRGVFKFWVIWVFCFLGMWTADLMWFLIGRIKSLSHLKKIKWIHKGYKRAKEEIENAPSELFLMILIKFAYGVGIPILMYLGRRGMKIDDFIRKNTTIITVWSTVIVIIGWVLGKTSAIAADRFKNIYAGAGLVVTGLIIINIVARWIERALVHHEMKLRKKSRKKKLWNI